VTLTINKDDPRSGSLFFYSCFHRLRYLSKGFLALWRVDSYG
jgi:hypothetical protein